MCQMHQWIEAGGSAHFLKNMKNLHSMYWFSVEGVKGIMIPKVGALAGAPFADLLFTFAASTGPRGFTWLSRTHWPEYRVPSH